MTKSKLKALRREGDGARDLCDWPRAIAAYSAYLSALPDDWSIQTQLGHAYKESGNLSAAELAYQIAVKCAPNDADLHLQMGHLLKLAGRRAEAVQSYLRSLKLDPTGPAADELGALGLPASVSKPDGAAVGGIRSSQRSVWTTVSEALRRRSRRAGDLARDQKDWPRAVKSYKTYLKRCPDDAAIWVQFGHGYKEIGDLEAAERAYRTAIAKAPSHNDAYMQLGHLLKHSGRTEDAEKCYAIDARLDLDNASANDAGDIDSASRSRARVRLSQWRTLVDAQAARDQRLWSIAETQYRAYLGVDAKSTQAWADLAYVLQSANRNDEARAALEHAKMLSPHNTEIQRQYQRLFENRGYDFYVEPYQ